MRAHNIQAIALINSILEALRVLDFEALSFKLHPDKGGLTLDGGVVLDIRKMSNHNIQGYMNITWKDQVDSWVFTAEITNYSASATGDASALPKAVTNALNSALAPNSITGR